MAAVTAATLIAAAAISATAGAVMAEEQRKSASKAASKQIRAIKSQPAPEAQATPEVGGDAREELRRRARARLAGNRKTIVTGDLTPPSARKSLLG